MDAIKIKPGKYRSSFLILFLLLFEIGFSANENKALGLQKQQRPRRVSTSRGNVPNASTKQAQSRIKAGPAAKPATIETPSATSQDETSKAQTSPSAKPSVPSSASVAARTIEELRAQIRETLAQPQFSSSHMAVKVASLDTGRIIYEENASKWMQPASNMKLYTVAAALDRLGPDYRFITSVYAKERPDTMGTVRGDLIIYGRGDPTFATRFTGETDYYKAIDELAARIVAAGVRRVEGDLVGDESYITGGPFGPGWEWDDLQWYYGAEISALSINDNAVDINVRPGAQAGEPCIITIGPATPLVKIVNQTTTAPRATQRTLKVHRPLGENTIEVSGSLPLDDFGYTASLAIARPAMMFVSMLRTALERQGVQITGETRVVDARSDGIETSLPNRSLVEIANRQSPPFSIIAAQTLKPSQNLYTELILRALGKAAASADPQKSSDAAGIEAVKAFLETAGIDSSKIVMLDGSGLSRGNLVTAEATLQLLIHMSRHRYASVFRESQPIAGIDGTLRTRMRNTPAAGNARAKTGTLSTATSLSGYVTSAAGERLVFSAIINNPPRDGDARTNFVDRITVLLASFAGRS